MILRVRAGEQIVADASRLKETEETGMVLLVDFLDRTSLAVGDESHGCAMRVRPADHQHVVSTQPMVACHNIARKMAARDIPDVDLRVGVGPRNRDQDILRHMSSSEEVIWLGVLDQPVGTFSGGGSISNLHNKQKLRSNS